MTMSVIEDAPPVAHLTVSGARKPSYIDVMQNIEAIEKVGRWIERSKFFGCDYPEQGCVIAIECFLRGVSPIDYQRTNKIVAGKPFMQYDAMLAAFRKLGGKYRLVESTPDAAKIHFEYEDEKYDVALTWEELSKEPYPYAVNEKICIEMFAAGKTPPLKPKYATPRSRQTMIMARLISSSLRYICPELVEGVYTEEEVGDIIDAEAVTVVESPEELAAKERKRAIAESKMAKPTTETTVTTTSTTKPADVAPSDAAASVEKPETIVTPNGKTVLETDPRVSEELAKQVTPELEATIKAMIARRYEEGMTNVAELIVGKLNACGYEKIAKLRTAEAQLLHQALVDNNLALFLDCNLIRADETPF